MSPYVVGQSVRWSVITSVSSIGALVPSKPLSRREALLLFSRVQFCGTKKPETLIILSVLCQARSHIISCVSNEAAKVEIFLEIGVKKDALFLSLVVSDESAEGKGRL